jgi:outer membrane lipoprotein SlyB
MKQLLMLLLFAVTACDSTPKKYKTVVDITREYKSYDVQVTEHSNHLASRTLGGAILGGAVGYMTGISMTKAAIGGAVVGGATSPNETSETYIDHRTDIYFTVIYSDSTRDVFKNYCWVNKGDKIEIY